MVERKEQEEYPGIECPVAGELAGDTAVVRAAYRAVSEEDAAALDRLVDPGVVWVHPMTARLPFDGTSCGLAAVLSGCFRRRDGGGPPFVAETFVELGDGVLVAGRFFEGERADVERPFLHECYVRNGRIFLIRGYPA